MNKILGLCLIGLLICVPGYAANSTKIIKATTLNDELSEDTSPSIKIQANEKVAFFVDYDETETGGGVSASVTLDVSYDGTNWVDASFLDFAGGPATFQTSETISADGWYYCWMDNRTTNTIYVRMVVTGTGVDVDDTITLNAYYLNQN